MSENVPRCPRRPSTRQTPLMCGCPRPARTWDEGDGDGRWAAQAGRSRERSTAAAARQRSHARPPSSTLTPGSGAMAHQQAGLLCRVGVLRRTTRAHRMRRGAAAAAPAPNSVPSAHWQTDAIGAPPARTHRPLQRDRTAAHPHISHLTCRLPDCILVYYTEHRTPNPEHRTLHTDPIIIPARAPTLSVATHDTLVRPRVASVAVFRARSRCGHRCSDMAMVSILSRALVLVCRHEADEVAGAGRG